MVYTVIRTIFLLPFLLSAAVLFAQRVPVLNQIDLPHNYYYHELYLPQLTSGPSSVAWMPDGKSLVYPMAGSLWKQELGSFTAGQLTDGDGYDYQPDISPDGTQILFTRYTGSSMELMILDLADKKTYSLTKNQQVNVEPRWSPDGKNIVFVSTLGTGHFLMHTASINNHTLTNLTVLIADHKSETARYYYSAFDHTINPTWSKDGNTIYFVTNRDLAHGTGNLSAFDLITKEVSTIQREETNWRTRPDLSPDGTRIAYSSYLGQNWHQLWILPVVGGYPIPLTYGDYDKSTPRWSPDGKKIAFISNREGNTSLWTLDAFSGKQVAIVAKTLNYLQPSASFVLRIQDEQGNLLPARVSITDSRGKFHAPPNAWIQADDSRYPSIQKFESTYFHLAETATLRVPKDKLNVQVSHGPLYEISNTTIDTRNTSETVSLVKLRKHDIPSGIGNWWSGDVHVHMNYGGSYRNTPAQLVKQAEAEDLNFVYNLIVNKEQRIPDVNYFSPLPDKASNEKVVILHGQEFHTSFWGHLGILSLKENLILPDYSGYPQTAASSLFPHNSFIMDLAHEQGALVGYVHPFDEVQIFPEQSPTLSHALPVDAALGKVNYYELVGFSDHLTTAAVWHHLLNVGLKIPGAAGTDAMANYASLRGPVGVNRVYVRGDGALNSDSFLNEMTKGRSFVTNGPIIGIQVGDSNPGDSIKMQANGETFSYKAFLRSNTTVDHFEVIFNGEVIASHIQTTPAKTLDITGKVKIKESGWIVVRAWNSTAQFDIQDVYAYASTNPIYVYGGKPSAQSKVSAAFFLKWVDRLEGLARKSETFRDENERNIILNDIKKARTYYESIR